MVQVCTKLVHNGAQVHSAHLSVYTACCAAVCAATPNTCSPRACKQHCVCVHLHVHPWCANMCLAPVHHRMYRAASVQSCRWAQDPPALRFTCRYVPLLCMHPDSHALPAVHLCTVHTCTLAYMCLYAVMHSLHMQSYMPALDCMPRGCFWDAAEVLPGVY